MNVGAAQERGGAADWLACSAVVFLAVAAYLPALDNGFSLDDYNHIERLRFAPSLAVFLVEPEPGELVSPVTKAFLVCLHEIFGLDPRGWHGTLLVLHAFNAVLVYLLGVQLLGERSVALLAACLFAGAAIGSEAVFWVAACAHLLVTSLLLSTLLLFAHHLETGARRSLWAAVVLFAAGLMVKATFYVAWPALVVVVLARDTGRRRWHSLLPFTILLLGALAANLVVALGRSYLIERGLYAPGWHVATSLGDYLARLVFPFRALLARLGLAAMHDPVLEVLAVAAPLAAGAAFALGDRRIRLALALIVLAFAPVLPFVYAPASRYAYLASVGWAWLLGLLFLRAERAHGRTAPIWPWLVPLALAPHLAEIVLQDNEYEYRERLMSRLVADVRSIYPEPPQGGTITILELPNFAIDRGIHLEAALRVAYDDRKLVLLTPEPGVGADGDALVYVDGRIQRRPPQP
jgi:hypothetical protein